MCTEDVATIWSTCGATRPERRARASGAVRMSGASSVFEAIPERG